MRPCGVVRRAEARRLHPAPTKASCRLPVFLFAELGDVGGVVFAVPLVDEEQPIDGALAVFGVD